MFKRQALGIDLGTASVRVYVHGKGVVLDEPAVLVLSDAGEVEAVGDEAVRLSKREPKHLTAVRPLRDGVVADYDLAETMLRVFIGRVRKGHLLRPDIAACVSSSLTENEKRATLQAARELAHTALTIEEPLAAAIGAGTEVNEPTGVMVVSLGGGTTDLAVISSGRVVAAESLRIAGDAFDEAIVRAVRHYEGLLIGDRAAEALKLEVGAATLDIPEDGDKVRAVRGRDLSTGALKTVQVPAEVVVTALQEPLRKVAGGVRRVLEAAPPELAADVIERGVLLTGGSAHLRNLSTFLQQQTGLPMTVAERPDLCAVLGAGRALMVPNLVRDPH